MTGARSYRPGSSGPRTGTFTCSRGSSFLLLEPPPHQLTHRPRPMTLTLTTAGTSCRDTNQVERVSQDSFPCAPCRSMTRARCPLHGGGSDDAGPLQRRWPWSRGRREPYRSSYLTGGPIKNSPKTHGITNGPPNAQSRLFLQSLGSYPSGATFLGFFNFEELIDSCSASANLRLLSSCCCLLDVVVQMEKEVTTGFTKQLIAVIYHGFFFCDMKTCQ